MDIQNNRWTFRIVPIRIRRWKVDGDDGHSGHPMDIQDTTHQKK